MSLKTPGPYIRLDQDIWDNEAIRALPPAAALGYIFMIAWSKDKRTDGLVSPRGVERCGVSAESLKALADASLIHADDDHWAIVDWSDWQTTNDEIEAVSAKRSRAGKASGQARSKQEAVQ